MLYHIFVCFKKIFPFCNLVESVAFRAVGALITSLLLSFALAPRFIALSKTMFRAKSREFTPEGHRAKDNTPTMGGLLILCAVLAGSLLWSDVSQGVVWAFCACLVSFGAIGFWDDWCKVSRKKGIASTHKFLAQLGVAGALMALLVWAGLSTQVSFLCFKSWGIDLGFLFVVWGMFILVGVSNAVNLTDGLDGLATGSLVSNFATFAVIASMGDCPEVALMGAALVGASLGFLWYNAYPAQIFMGDVGSLSLGAALAFMALVTKQELLLPITGAIFVAEALSVMLQVASFKLRGKRIFKMAPLHHHFELIGWRETKITTRFSIITFVLCVLGLLAFWSCNSPLHA